MVSISLTVVLCCKCNMGSRISMEKQQPEAPITGPELTEVQYVKDANARYVASGQHTPNMPLGVARRLAVLTCMDSRLFPEAFLGLSQGDAEVIRNGGGRVTEDVIRSMIICQDMLECNTVLVIHHTDCGGQHAVFHPAAVVEHAKHLAKDVLDVGEGGINMQPILPGMLESSVREDVAKLRAEPRIKSQTALVGMVFDTATGQLKEVCRG